MRGRLGQCLRGATHDFCGIDFRRASATRQIAFNRSQSTHGVTRTPATHLHTSDLEFLCDHFIVFSIGREQNQLRATRKANTDSLGLRQASELGTLFFIEHIRCRNSHNLSTIMHNSNETGRKSFSSINY